MVSSIGIRKMRELSKFALIFISYSRIIQISTA
jgi:hypothetical protein